MPRISRANTDLRGADFSGQKLGRSDFRGANCRYANFAGCQLVGADFRGANLEHANVAGADLRNADLRGVNLDMTELVGAKLRGARFDWGAAESEPIQLLTELFPVWVFDQVIRLGCSTRPLPDFLRLDPHQVADMAEGAADWWTKWRPVIAEIYAARITSSKSD